jgi:hypothetical protein
MFHRLHPRGNHFLNDDTGRVPRLRACRETRLASEYNAFRAA